MAEVVALKDWSAKTHSSFTEMKVLTLADFEKWQQPRFQRPIKINQKVMEFADGLKKNGGVISGILTLGQLPNDAALYKVDGAHRVEAAKLCGLPEFIAEVRIIQIDNIGEMADEFVKLNSNLVRFRPDDFLRGYEENLPMLKRLREICPFIGYDHIRCASTGAPTVGVSQILRCWFGSSAETPKVHNNAAIQLAEMVDEKELSLLTGFLLAAYNAWGHDPENYRLWATLNITVSMWMYRQIVISPRTKRTLSLNVHDFGKCLMSVSASRSYVDWLVGRNVVERDRSPCYTRLKAIFMKRVMDDGLERRPMFPQPMWYVNK
jgi:hypothetical protein